MNAKKISALIAAFGLSVSLVACSSDEGENGTTEETSASAAETTASSSDAPETETPDLPSAAELNDVLARATDSSLPMEDRVQTVQGGETAPELFDTMAMSQEESGANFQVVDPVLPGYAPNSVLTTVNFTQPDQATQLAENVEFIYEDGQWQLSQSWACTLITNTVEPDQVPEMCAASAPEGESTDAPADASEPAPAQ
ncbi:hypothetical protein [Corynebacterium lubricantis]|uniref:hypothetical protein n=1 Tax=Corynebacterium lubricantis TaxID=541095 RepID=UPI00036DBE27|nr:hypothetical protein [Corynebacterium lubricantis]